MPVWPRPGHLGLASNDETKAYFRQSREARLGKALESVRDGRDAGLTAFRASLEPLRSMLTYQPFLGGPVPLYPDYIVFGALQCAAVAAAYKLLEDGDPVLDWFGRCLGLHGGLGRTVDAAR